MFPASVLGDPRGEVFLSRGRGWRAIPLWGIPRCHPYARRFARSPRAGMVDAWESTNREWRLAWDGGNREETDRLVRLMGGLPTVCATTVGWPMGRGGAGLDGWICWFGCIL
jgi:hypothetical protein